MKAQETVNKLRSGETVNISSGVKLSKLQKTILRKLYDLYFNDPLSKVWSVYGVESKMLSWEVAKAYEGAGGRNYITWEEAKIERQLRKAEALKHFAENSPSFYAFAEQLWRRKSRYYYAQLLPRLRASLSRRLKRLEERGLILRTIDRHYFARVKPKTIRIYLTVAGARVAKEV